MQAFTAIGKVSDDEIYQHKISDDFTPYRHNMEFYEAEETPIVPLIDKLAFIENKQAWGFRFRFGFFAIGEADFKLIWSATIKGKLTPTDKL